MIHDQEQSEEEQPDPWYKGPIKIVLALFLLLILSMWIFAYYAVDIDPQPKNIPTINQVFNIQEVNISEFKNVNSRSDYYLLLNPNKPTIKQTADKIATYSCDANKICHAKAIYYFVRDNFEYVSDPNTFEYVKSAEESLSTHGGDCDDGAVLLANLLEAVGIRTEFVFIPKHVYVKAYLPETLKRYKSNDGWIHLDVTCKSCEFGAVPRTG